MSGGCEFVTDCSIGFRWIVLNTMRQEMFTDN